MTNIAFDVEKRNGKSENIPNSLKALCRWVCWRYEERGGKKTKIPINARTLGFAKSNEPSTWVLFNAALSQYQDQGNLDGIGIMLGDGLAGIDIDNNDSRKDEIILAMNTYTEYSPSGNGVHLLFWAETKGRKCGNLEIYSSGRFFTITGDHVQGTPSDIQGRQEQADRFLATYFRDQEPEKQATQMVCQPITDERLREALEGARRRPYSGRFDSLWRGEWEACKDYPSQSEADQALCNYLAWELGPDAEAIDAMFRKSGLFRDKWEREDYRRRTIDNAISGLPSKVAIEELEPGLPDTPRKELGLSFVEMWDRESKLIELIPGALISGTHTLFSARDKRGKSDWGANFISDWLSLGFVMGQPVKPMSFIYLDFEMGFDLFKRFYFARKFPRLDDSKANNCKERFRYIDRDTGLPDFLTVDWLQRLIERYKPGQIWIDTIRGANLLSPEIAAADNWENNASWVGKLLRPYTNLAHKTGVNIITIHHNNKQDNYSGSTEFGASVDAIWSFTAPNGKESAERKLHASGRGVSGSWKFSYNDGRYYYDPSKGPIVANEETAKILAAFNPPKTLNEASSVLQYDRKKLERRIKPLLEAKTMKVISGKGTPNDPFCYGQST